MRDLVLVGGGHAHVHVLADFGWRPDAGVRVTLLTPDAATPYSGMLPGLVAGQYRREEVFLDLRRLAAVTGARLIPGRACGIDRAAGLVRVDGAPPIPFDVLSLDIGSSPPLDDVPGARDHALPVKPVDRFLDALDRMTADGGGQGRPGRLILVGGGAAGVEIALALCARFRPAGVAPANAGPAGVAPAIILVTRGPLLPGFNERSRRLLRRILADHAVTVREEAPVAAVTAGTVRLEDGSEIAGDAVIWATGAAPQAWLRQTGLALDDRGFVQVDSCLRSVTDPRIFAAGDIAALPDPFVEKAGVFAVRQGPPLADNLHRVLAGLPPEPYRPQRQFLRLVNTGDGRAVAARGPFAAAGRWVWWWKNHIDRAWMRRYQSLA
ncbi:MAG: selenide, water dikinase SelD [Pseudomonadota bacterium]